MAKGDEGLAGITAGGDVEVPELSTATDFSGETATAVDSDKMGELGVAPFSALGVLLGVGVGEVGGLRSSYLRTRENINQNCSSSEKF